MDHCKIKSRKCYHIAVSGTFLNSDIQSLSNSDETEDYYFTENGESDGESDGESCDHEAVNIDLIDLVENITPSHHDLIQDKLVDNNENLPETIPCSCCVKQCHLNFSREEIQQFKLQYLSLNCSELDNAALAKIACGVHLGSEMKRSKKSQQTDHKSHCTDYIHQEERSAASSLNLFTPLGKTILTTYSLIISQMVWNQELMQTPKDYQAMH
ncbi:hypothetical protein PoB_004251200 [Plakobranchus ocellatus]|uniref:Uncharacterized protein n=1 Tax=Plakobranchus ocellatus TaxID=259542 RepID=A0AAV4BA40_9GAST|nr:hypothetical protein PoB_004251200 [Plakobranchus ocellatus]